MGVATGERGSQKAEDGAWSATESASVISEAFNKVKQISDRFSSSSDFQKHGKNFWPTTLS